MKLCRGFIDDCGDEKALFEQGRQHLAVLRTIVANPSGVATTMTNTLITQAALWHASVAARTDASDAQFVLQRLFEDNMLYSRVLPLAPLLRAASASDAKPSRATTQHVTQLMWLALGIAARHRRIKHDGRKQTFDDDDLDTLIVFGDVDLLTLYYMAGYAGRCTTKWRRRLVDAALASRGSIEYRVFSAIYGNDALLSQSPLAHKINSLRVSVGFVHAARRSRMPHTARRSIVFRSY